MTGDELRSCIERLDWSMHELAGQTGVSPTTARRWLSGQAPIPENVAQILVQMIELADRLARKPD